MKPELSVIIPVRDEHDTIEAVVREIDSVMFNHNIPGEIIIVDDNSTPALPASLFMYSGFHIRVKVCKNILGPGLAEALKTGLTYANSKYVIFMSGDGMDSPEAIELIYRRLLNNSDCVFCQRRCTWRSVKRYGVVKWVASRLGNRLISLFFDCRYHDYTDMFKGYRLSVAMIGLDCRAKGFGFPLELCLRALLKGTSYSVVPTAPRSRIAGTSKFRLRHKASEYLITLWRCLKLKYWR